MMTIPSGIVVVSWASLAKATVVGYLRMRYLIFLSLGIVCPRLFEASSERTAAGLARTISKVDFRTLKTKKEQPTMYIGTNKVQIEAATGWSIFVSPPERYRTFQLSYSCY